MLPPQRRSSSRHDNGSRPQTLPRHSHAGSNRIPGSLPERLPGDVPGKVPLGVPPDQLSQWTGILEKISEVKLLPMLNIILKHLLLSAIGFPYYNIFAKGKHFLKHFCPQVNIELTSREEELVRLGQRARRLEAKGQEAKSRTVVSHRPTPSSSSSPLSLSWCTL